MGAHRGRMVYVSQELANLIGVAVVSPTHLTKNRTIGWAQIRAGQVNSSHCSHRAFRMLAQLGQALVVISKRCLIVGKDQK